MNFKDRVFNKGSKEDKKREANASLFLYLNLQAYLSFLVKI